MLASQFIAFAREDPGMKHPRRYPIVLWLLRKVRCGDEKRGRLKESIMVNMSSAAKVMGAVLTWMQVARVETSRMVEMFVT